MNFGQIIKNVLDKNQQVWLPTIGLISFDKITAKLNIDPYGYGTDTEIVNLVSDIHQISQGEAKGKFIQEIEQIKTTIQSEGKYSIEGLGDIKSSGAGYEIEAKKTLFPTDFFGGGNFNPASFANNAPIKEEKPVSIKIETPKVEEPIVDIKEEVKIEEPIVVAEEPVNETPKVEELIPEAPKPKGRTKKVVEEIIETPKVEEKYIPQTIVEERYEEVFIDDNKVEEVFIEEKAPIIEEKIELGPRRNIGKAEYDEGFYEKYTHRYTQSESKSNVRWGRIGGLLLGLLALAFFIPWIVASFNGSKFLGLDPLWSTKKVDKVIAVKTQDTVTSTKIDTAKLADTRLKDSLTNLANQITIDSLKKIEDSKKATSTTTIASTTKPSVSPAPAQKPKVNTTPKTPTATNPSKTVAVATDKKTDAKVDKKVEVAKAPKVKDTTKKVMAVKAPKINVIGAPYATANYSKGNTYVSFGKFKVASVASNLSKNLKSKGLETDVILVDGTYRVVIPYINKEKALSTAADYPTATTFE